MLNPDQLPTTPAISCPATRSAEGGGEAVRSRTHDAPAARAPVRDGNKVCHFNHEWYAPTVAPFPECPELDNVANCRFAPVGGDMAPYVRDTVCDAMAFVGARAGSKCSAVLRAIACARFDPTVLARSLSIATFRPLPGAHVETLSICGTGELCSYINDQCGPTKLLAPFAMCGKTECTTDADCAGWPLAPAGSKCVRTTLTTDSTVVSTCLPVVPSCAGCTGTCTVVDVAPPPRPTVTGTSSSSGMATTTAHPAQHPPAGKKGGNGGVVVGIIFLVLGLAFAGYCVIGVVYNRFNGAQGADQLPNAAFWSAAWASVTGLAGSLRARWSRSAAPDGFAPITLDPPDYDFDA